jgi:hypothetical protein
MMSALTCTSAPGSTAIDSLSCRSRAFNAATPAKTSVRGFM